MFRFSKTFVATAATVGLMPFYLSLGKPVACESQKEDAATLAMWAGRWSKQMTGWHQKAEHHTLAKYADSVLKGRRSVLVPLCGKTVDLTTLALRGHDVLGVEGIHKAIIEYSIENCTTIDLDPMRSTGEYGPKFDSYVGRMKEGGKVELLKGDFFDLPTIGLERVDAVWDRASIVAINPSLRREYVDCIGHVLKSGGII